MDEANTVRPPAETSTPQARKSLWGAFWGYFVDNFDIFLPVVALPPALIYFVPPEVPATTNAIIFGLIFATTLLGRPLGALIFGHLGDTIGRKRTAMISVTGFGVMSVFIAVLPGYQQWGLLAVGLLIVFRLIDGIFVGGEYTAASPLAMEYSPREKRGLYGGVIQSAAALAFSAISLTTLVVLSMVPAGSLDSPYVQWGWRIPFLIGAATAFAFVFYYYFSVSESELWQASAKANAPLKTLFSGANLKSFLQVFMLMSGYWLTLFTAVAIMPSLLGSTIGASSILTSLSLLVAYLVITPIYIAEGVISQRTGRRTWLMLTGGISAIVGTFFYYLFLSTAPENSLMVIVLTTVVTALVVSPGAVMTVYINERFHTSVRASGFGLGYSLAIIIPSFYAFYQAGLATFMPFEYTVLVLVVIGGLLVLGAAAWGPETKGLDFSADSSSTPPEKGSNA